MLKIYCAVLTLFVSHSLSFSAKIIEIAGEPAPAEVNLEWAEFSLVDFMENQRLPESISGNKLVLNEEGKSQTTFSLALLTAKLSGSKLQEPDPEKNVYWRSSRNVHQSLIENSIELNQPHLTKLYARSYMMHILGGNSLQHQYTLDPSVMEKISELHKFTIIDGRSDDIAEAVLMWVDLYQWTSENKELNDWKYLDFLNVAQAYKGDDPLLKQIYYAIRFRFIFRSNHTEGYKLYEEEILPDYRAHGILFSCYHGFLYPYADIGRMMSDIESHHQSIAINRISLERLKKAKQNDKINNPDR